jgi:REP element-mobilizing transposase RayT
MWNLPAPPGFVGFDPESPVRIYQRNLPHWRQEGATYFTTFRLADSLPEARLLELSARRAAWERANPPPRSEGQWKALARTTIEHIERWLDEGAGSCMLRQTIAGDIVEAKLRHFDGVRYELGAYVVMPNHVHALVRPYSDASQPLETIEQGWKGFSSREIHVALGSQGQLWQFESYDRIVRDEEHLWKCLQYIGDNPRRAGLGLQDTRLWVCPAWVHAGWNFQS